MVTFCAIPGVSKVTAGVNVFKCQAAKVGPPPNNLWEINSYKNLLKTNRHLTNYGIHVCGNSHGIVKVRLKRSYLKTKQN